MNLRTIRRLATPLALALALLAPAAHADAAAVASVCTKRDSAAHG